MLNKTFIVFFVLINFAPTVKAANASVSIGLNIEIKNQHQCNYLFTNEKTGNSTYTQRGNCTASHLEQLQESTSQIRAVKDGHSTIRMIKTIQ